MTIRFFPGGSAFQQIKSSEKRPLPVCVNSQMLSTRNNFYAQRCIPDPFISRLNLPKCHRPEAEVVAVERSVLQVGK